MTCTCSCECDQYHRECKCRITWCGCLIKLRKTKKRRRCGYCNSILLVEPLTSMDGYFVGQICPEDGLMYRISDVYLVHKNLMKHMGIKLRDQEDFKQPL